MRNIRHSGKGREYDSLLEIMVALQVAAELKYVPERRLQSCRLSGVGQSVKTALKFSPESVVDGDQVVRVILMESRHGVIV